MKKLFLASSIETTGSAIGREIGNPEKKKLAFIYTAAEPNGINSRWLEKDKQGLRNAGFQIIDYTITDKGQNDFDNDLRDCDVIHINGGDSFYLKLQAEKSGFDKWIKEQILTGKRIYTGSSAGSIFAAENIEQVKKIETRKYEKMVKDYNGTGLVDFLIFPHWGSRIFRDLYLKERLDFAYKPENKIILLNDFQYVKVEDDKYKIIDIRD